MGTESIKYGMNLLTLVALVTMFALNLAGVIENRDLQKEVDQLERNSLPDEFVVYSSNGDGAECKNYAFGDSEFSVQMVDKHGNTQQYFCRD